MKKTVYKGFTLRIYPKKQKQRIIDLNCELSNYVYNQFLRMQKDRYFAMKDDDSAKKYCYIGKFDCDKLLTQFKKEQPFLKQVDSNALLYSIANLDKAYQNFFKGRAKTPRFKNKYAQLSYTTKASTIRITDDLKHIVLPKLKEIRFKYRGDKSIIEHIKNSKIVNVTVRKDNTNKYFASIIYESDVYELPKTNKEVGIDLGLSHLAIQSDGIKIENHRYKRQMQKELIQAQRTYSRRLELARAKIAAAKKVDCELSYDSFKNLTKARINLAKIHQKIANQRKAQLHNYTKQLVENYDLIALEKLKSSNLMKNHHLADAIGDVSWYQLYNLLQYKADWYGKQVVTVSPKNTSRICSNCGKNTGAKPLHVRQWTCPYCHTHHDRDVNASVNILNKAKRQLANTK